MAEIEVEFINRGLWTDLARGSVLGRTITTNVQTGNILVALLAVFSTIATAHLWHLVTFCIHQVRADGRQTDALFRQQQALLRTSPPPSSVVADTVKLWWSWRAKAKRPFLRSFMLIIIAILFSVGTISGSVFSSLAVTSDNLVVLVSSPFCGFLSDDRQSRLSVFESIARAANSYAFQCYGEASLGTITTDNSTKTSRACKVFPQQSVPLTAQLTECPFGAVCGHDDALSIDSGVVDVNSAFGLNLPANERVQYRKMTTCQVLTLEGYTEAMDPEEWSALTGAELLRGWDGGYVLMDYGASPTYANMTVGRNTTAALRVGEGMENGVTSGLYVHHTSSGLPRSQHFTFEPIDELRREDGDTSVEIVKFTEVYYNQTVEDPFFRAHSKRWKITDGGVNRTFYMPDWPSRANACLHQYQFCYKRNPRDFCSPLAGVPGIVSSATFPDATELQLAVIRLLAQSSYLFETNLRSRTAWVLQAVYDVRGPVLAGIPDDEWLRNLINTEKRVWASLQMSVADYAIGPTTRLVDQINVTDQDKPVGIEEALVAPVTDGEKRLCGMQRMAKAGGVVNISFFALVFILTFSLFLALLDIFILKVLIYMSSFRSTLAPRIDRWIADGVWQLQRRAYEAQGHTEWEETDSEIPLTREKRADTFSDLPPPRVGTWGMVKGDGSGSDIGEEGRGMLRRF